jgi:hypothetical protein
MAVPRWPQDESPRQAGLGELGPGGGLGLARQVGLGKVSWDESPRQAWLGELGLGGLRDRGRARSRAGRPRAKARRSLSS